MGGRVSTLVLSGGEAGGGERAVKSLSPQSWAEKIGRKKGTGWGGGGGEKELKSANVYQGFTVCQVRHSPVC